MVILRRGTNVRGLLLCDGASSLEHGFPIVKARMEMLFLTTSQFRCSGLIMLLYD